MGDNCIYPCKYTITVKMEVDTFLNIVFKIPPGGILIEGVETWGN